jgi:hypothetical protein
MHIICIQNNNQRVLVNYSPELIYLLKRFFASAEERNQRLKMLIEDYQKETPETPGYPLLQQLISHSEETEIDIELVKKLLPQ